MEGCRRRLSWIVCPEKKIPFSASMICGDCSGPFLSRATANTPEVKTISSGGTMR
jgi:hypothetical protein